MKQPKIAVLFSNYGPYHFARVNQFHIQCSASGMQCVGIELARSEATYAWVAEVKTPYPFVSIVPDQQLEQVRIQELIKRVFATLNRIDPTVIAIAGYGIPGMIAAATWAILRRKPMVLLSASKEDDASRSIWKERIKAWFINRYDAALVGGQPQKRYLVKLGMPENRVFTGYNVVGNETFAPEKIRSLPRPIERPFFLAVNRFVPRKNLVRLILAYAAYRETVGDRAWNLVLCGEGSSQAEIEAKIQEHQLEAVVHLPGFLQQAELLPYFAHAECFVHTSLQEQWGLVINEAMAAGLPVIISNLCGCYEDLVIEGETGFGFDPEDTEALTHCLVKMSSIEYHTMGEAGLRRIQKFSPAYFAESLYQAVQSALAK
ncbi:MAG: hexosyltransferase [Leptolyngbya sp. ERB_1_2]